MIDEEYIQTGLKNADYLYIFFNIILPIAYEVKTKFRKINSYGFFYQYDPDLVLISAGYDVALGCPEVTKNILCLHEYISLN